MSDTPQESKFLTTSRDTEIPDNALRILHAAVELFSKKGYAATSVREIVQEADVTSPMLYYYFDSKEGLFSSLTDMLHREFAKDIATAIDEAESFEDALEAVVTVHLRGVRESPDVLRLVYSLLFGATGSSPAHRLFESHAVVSGALKSLFDRAKAEGAFEPAFDSQWLVEQLLGLVNSHSMRLVKELEIIDEPQREDWLAKNTDADMVRRIVRFFLNGAKL